MSTPLQTACANRLLATLTPADFALLSPLALTVLALGARLIQRDAAIERVHFVEHGIVSCIATTTDGEQIGTGLVGYEGLIGVPIVLGTDRTPHEAQVQSPGLSLSLPAKRLAAAMRASPSRHAPLLRYAQAVTVQVAATALANGRYTMDQRLARWLLKCHDRTKGDVLPTTQQFLSLMLGVRRSGVNDAVSRLVDASLVATQRGTITILDPNRLLAKAGASYGEPEAEYERLFGGLPPLA